MPIGVINALLFTFSECTSVYNCGQKVLEQSACPGLVLVVSVGWTGGCLSEYRENCLSQRRVSNNQGAIWAGDLVSIPLSLA